jgi:hypothetical protein
LRRSPRDAAEERRKPGRSSASSRCCAFPSRNAGAIIGSVRKMPTAPSTAKELKDNPCGKARVFGVPICQSLLRLPMSGSRPPGVGPAEFQRRPFIVQRNAYGAGGPSEFLQAPGRPMGAPVESPSEVGGLPQERRWNPQRMPCLQSLDRPSGDVFDDEPKRKAPPLSHALRT